jgi:nitroreductase
LTDALPEPCLAQLFRDARTHNAWLPEDVPDALLHAIVDLVKLAPTSATFRNGTLQGVYLIMAARALGLDCGPMSGFDSAGVDRDFFAGTNIKSNFLCSLGHGDASVLLPRSPRFSFDEMARIL